MLAMALTKGRLEKLTVKLLEQSGYGIEPLKNKGRALVFHDTQKPLDYFLVKAPDCVTYVRHGVADIGVVGKDTLLESEDEYFELMDLGIGKCRFILASRPDHNVLTKMGHIKIATKYPHVATAYFKQKGLDVEIIKLEGSVELAAVLGLCDAIVDITETGNTLKENGLIIYDTVCDISARIIVNKASFRLKRAEIDALLADLRQAVKEEGIC